LADEIRKSLFNFGSAEERARLRREEDRQRNQEKLLEEKHIGEQEVEELERSAMALEAAMCRLSELETKHSQRGAPEPVIVVFINLTHVLVATY
jgi:hypothetical protein